MLSPWLTSVLLVATLAFAMAGLSACRRQDLLDAEIARKCLHVGAGLLALALPWLLTHNAAVILTTVMVTGWFIAVRMCVRIRLVFGLVLHDTGRVSHGELYFTGAVLALLVLVPNDPLLYVVPILIVTLADTCAALIGTHTREPRFLRGGQGKTLEGSVAFFAVAAICTYLPVLLLANATPSDALLISVTVALITTVVEAASEYGLDNLLVPLAALVSLKVLTSAAPAAVALHSLTLLGTAAFAFYCLMRIYRERAY